jgi:hypothetical protein
VSVAVLGLPPCIDAMARSIERVHAMDCDDTGPPESVFYIQGLQSKARPALITLSGQDPDPHTVQ